MSDQVKKLSNKEMICYQFLQLKMLEQMTILLFLAAIVT